jgi:hypothetical protein
MSTIQLVFKGHFMFQSNEDNKEKGRAAYLIGKLLFDLLRRKAHERKCTFVGINMAKM